MKMEYEVIKVVTDYVFEKIGKQGLRTNTITDQILLLGTNLDTRTLIDFLTENVEADSLLNEKRRATVSKKEYFERKAVLVQVQVMLAILKRSNDPDADLWNSLKNPKNN
jgi:hypothetical protein